MRPARSTTAIAALAAAAIAASPAAPARTACTWTSFRIPVATDANHRALITSVAAASAREAWASGEIVDVRNPLYGPKTPLMLHWNGKSWRLVAAPGPFGEMAAIRGEAWAAGGRLHWHAGRWTVVKTPGGPLSYVAVISPTDAWAAGNTRAGLAVVHWDGRRWSQAPAPDFGASGVIAGLSAVPRTSQVWIYGSDSTTDGESAALWTGKGWRTFSLTLPTGLAGWSTFQGTIAASSATNAWIGMTGDDGKGHNQPLALHWDGSAWSVVPTLNPGGNTSVNGVAVRGDSDAWMVGTTVSGKKGRAIVLHWDGSTWSATAVPRISAVAVATVVGTNEVWVAGVATLALHRC